MSEESWRQETFEGISQWFWDIIQRADKDWDKLTTILNKLTKKQVYRFAQEFERAILLLNDDPWIEKMTLDGYISEDDIDDVIGWIVSQGQAYYLQVLADARKTPLMDEVDDRQNLSGVAYSVYSRRFNDDLFIDI